MPSSDPILAAVLDSVDCGVLLFDASGNLLGANNRLAEMLGMEPTRLREIADFETLVARLAPQFAGAELLAAKWRRRFQCGESSWDELELLPPMRKVIERFARPVWSGDGRRVGWLEVYRDVTAQRLVETKLFHTNRMAALGQLVSSVAHELNNPLTSVLGYAQLLCRRRRGTGYRNEAQHILEEAERASRIAKNLLLFSREATERVRVNLNEVVERTLALRSYELRLGNIQVQSDLETRLPLTLADAAQIQQVLLNLLLNAEQALQQRGGPGRIQLRTYKVSMERVAILVADNGPGIAAGVLPHIFDPFFTTKPPGIGTGLGLSIVYGIVQEHGGEVLVESREGHGTTFTIRLPIAKQAAPAAPVQARKRTRALPYPGSGRSPGNNIRRSERILVVEDEPTVARLIADVLNEEGHAVDTALDSREGLNQIGRQEYGLVICDLRMPHLDGRDFYGELLRQDSPLARRLVFITGDTLSPHAVEFLEKNGLRYLAKPFLVEELKEAVQGALTAACQQGSSDAGFEDAARSQPTMVKRR